MLISSMLEMMNWTSSGHSRFLEAMQPYVTERKSAKCLLPSCNVQTKHNGGYCCGDHCREHNKMLKEKRQVK